MSDLWRIEIFLDPNYDRGLIFSVQIPLIFIYFTTKNARPSFRSGHKRHKRIIIEKIISRLLYKIEVLFIFEDSFNQ